MKKFSKRMLALMLAVVMAIPTLFVLPSAASADDGLSSHLRAQYLTDSNLTQDKVGSNNLETRNGGGMYWDSIACKFPSGSSKPYYRVRLNDILSTVDFNQGFTIAFTAVRSESSWQRYLELSTDEGFTSNGSSSYLYFATNGNAKVRYKGGGETGNSGTGDEGGWNNWVVTVKNGSFQIYKNGSQAGSVTDGKVSSDWFTDIKDNGYLLLGASSYSNDGAFGGSMRDVRIYDTYVSSSSIGDLSSGTTTINPNGRSCVSNNSGRWSDGRVNIVNDGTKGAISAGLYRFDISGLPSTGYVDWASATFTVQSASNATMAHHQIDFYCRNGADLNGYINNGHYGVDWGEWSEGTANFRNNLGLNASTYIGTMQHKDLSDGKAVTVDLTEALITARENGWSSIILVAISRNISNNGSPWSDTWLYDPFILASVNDVSSNGTYDELTAAIRNYESKMQHAPYTNMKVAYDAYVMANRFADAMYYGEETPATSRVQSVINNLVVATENMKPWTYRTGDFSLSADYTVNKAQMLKGVTAGENANGGTEGGFKVYDYSDYMDNVLYAMGVGDQSNNGDSWKRTAGIFGSAGTSIALEYGPIVFLYDGVTTPAMPINLKSWYSGWDDDWTAIWINGTSDLSLTDCWHGHTGSREYQHSWYGDVYHTYDTNANPTGDDKSTYYYSTTLFYRGGNSSGFNNYLRTYDSIAWAGKNQSNAYNEANNATHIYVVDYKSLRDKIASKVSTIQNVTAYKEGGMSSLLGVMDKAVDLDPNHYIMYYPNEQNTQQATEISGASTLANDIGSRVSELNGASATADEATYNNLRAEMRTAHSTHPTGNSAYDDYHSNASAVASAYTTSSVASFRTAYEYAKWHMGCLVDWPYTHGEVPASGRLSNLVNAHNSLEQKADFSALDAAKDAAIAEVDSATIVDANTTSSVAAAKAYLQNATEFPYEYSADRNDTGVSKNSEIAAEKTKFDGWKNAVSLDKRADLSKLEKAYAKADALLLGLNGKAARYDKASVEALINAVTTAKKTQNITAQTMVKADAATRANYGQAVQTDANALADDIYAAIEGLTIVAENVSQVDLSAYEAAVSTINKLDPDAYEESTDGSIATAISNANTMVSTSTETYSTATINVVDSAVTQGNIEDATTGILTALTKCVKKYDIVANSGVTEIGARNGEYKDGKATYGTTMTFKSGDSDTAWYMSIKSGTIERTMQFQGYGSGLETRVMGKTEVKAVKRTTENPCRIRVIRDYDNDDKAPVDLVDFVSEGREYTLEAAPAVPYYTFDGYYVDGEKVTGNTVTVSGDVDVIAYYTVNNDASCAINATDISGTLTSKAAQYNEKVELEGGNGAYAWVEATDDTGLHFRPFYIGKNVSMFASEPTELKAVTEEQFNAYGFTLPAINLRKGGTVKSGEKTIFNAQLVAGNADVQEYGILVGTGNITEDMLNIENSGTHEDYRVLRAKSTRLVGANQFSIAIKGLPDNYIYRGYVIYSDGSSLQTEYTEIN